MGILELLDKYPVALIGVVGATLGVIGSLAGVAITSWFNLKAKDKEAANARKLKFLDNSIDFQKRHVVEPIIAFLESDLKLISYVYECGLEKDTPPKNPEQSVHIRLLAMTEARIKTLGDKLLEEKFRVFTRKRLEVGNKILDEMRRDPNAAYEKLQEAITLASEILVSVKDKIQRSET